MHVVLINMFKGFMLHTNNWGTCLDIYVFVYMKFTWQYIILLKGYVLYQNNWGTSCLN